LSFLGTILSKQGFTRCIGNYQVKGGYKDFEELAIAKAEPVTAEPDLHGGITLDASCRFLLLMSDGLYKSLQEVTGHPDTVNKEIAEMVVQQVLTFIILTFTPTMRTDRLYIYTPGQTCLTVTSE